MRKNNFIVTQREIDLSVIIKSSFSIVITLIYAYDFIANAVITKKKYIINSHKIKENGKVN